MFSPMLDVHCHLLPSLDDGAKTIDESIAILQGLQSAGITHVVATPHFYAGKYVPTVSEIDLALENVRQAAQKAAISIDVIRGRECFFDFELSVHEERESFPFLWDERRFQLIELPLEAPPHTLSRYVTSLHRSHVTPILAHAERYGWISKEPGRIQDYKDMGFRIQVDAMSFAKKAHKAQKASAMKLLESEGMDLLASDIHRPSQIESFKEGIEYVRSKVGDEKLSNYFILS